MAQKRCGNRYSYLSGNIVLALFAAIGAIGLIGATGMTVLKGPVRSMHTVTQKTLAENNIIASTKLAVMAAGNQANGGDCDSDGTIEPVAWSTTGTGPKPTGGGYLPANIGAALQDPWGNTYGYCVWDHGTAIQTTCPTPTQRLKGAGIGGSGPVITIISSGPDRTFQTSCADAPTYVQKVSGSDDIVLSYTYAEAVAASGGLWNLQASDPETAEIGKNLAVKDSSGDTTFELDRETGIGDFIGIRAGSIAAKGVEPVQMAGGLKMDNETNVTQCSLPQHAGTLRYHSTDGLQVCNGTEWVNAGGGKSVMPTISGGLQIESGKTANAIYTPTVQLPKGVYFSYFYNCLAGASVDYFVSMSAEATAGTINVGATNRNYSYLHSFTQVPFIMWVTSDTATVRFKVWNPDGGMITSPALAHNCSAFYYYQLVAAGVDPGGSSGGGSSLWTQLGSNIYYNTGNVGIGTSTPTSKLQIQASSPYITLQDTRPASNPALEAGLSIKDSAGASIGFMGDGSVGSNMMQFWSYVDRIALGTSLAYPITFHTNYASSSGLDSSERLRISATGNVGIGTLAPEAKLHAKSTGIEMTNGYSRVAVLEAEHPVIQFKGTNGNRSGFIGYDSQTTSLNPEGMRFWVGKTTDDHGGTSAAAMTIKSDGNVGIGQHMPTAQLHLLGKDTVAPIYIDRPFHGPSIIMRNIAGPGTVNTYPNVTDKWEIYPAGVTAAGTASRLSFVSRNTSEVPTTQMSISNTGTLNVTGGIGFAGGRGGMNYYNVSPYDQVELGVSSSFPSTSLSFFTNSISRMNINPAGLVGIGTVSPQELLHVAGGTRVDGHLKGGGGSNFHLDTSTTTMGLYLNYYSTGNVYARGTLLASSDIRLKKDIVPIESSLDKLAAMNGVYFEWKDPERKGKQVGLIAQEVEKVFPELVVEDEKGFKTVSYSALVAPLINAVKELKSLIDDMFVPIKDFKEQLGSFAARLDNQDAQLEMLKKENESLRARLDALEKKDALEVAP